MLSPIRRVVEIGASIVGVRGGTEQPTYSVQRLVAGVEIRRYRARIAAETTVTAEEVTARSIGFRRLAGYIFGGNHSNTTVAMTAPVAQQPSSARREKIAMTAPVSQRAAADGEWVIRFFMPAAQTMSSLPQPDDPSVRLVEVAPETVAVHRFSGRATRDAVASHTATLLKALSEADFHPIGQPTAWFYDPPWTLPPLRRNEIAVEVVADACSDGAVHT